MHLAGLSSYLYISACFWASKNALVRIGALCNQSCAWGCADDHATAADMRLWALKGQPGTLQLHLVQIRTEGRDDNARLSKLETEHGGISRAVYRWALAP